MTFPRELMDDPAMSYEMNTKTRRKVKTAA